MPKLFPISIEVEEVAVGKVMRVLDSLPGVAKIKFVGLDQKKPNGDASHTRAPRGEFEKTGEETVIAALLKKSPLTTEELRNAFTAEGRSPKSISSCLYVMIEKEEIKRTADGYVLSKKMKDRLRHRKANKK